MNPEGFGDRQYHNDLENVLIRYHDSELSFRDAQIESLRQTLDITNRLVGRYERAMQNWRRAYAQLALAYEAREPESEAVPA